MDIPDQGDICYMNFANQELRPVVVISKQDFNKYTSRAIVCPITLTTKKYFTHYELLKTKEIKGQVLCEQVRSIDFKTGNLTLVEKIAREELAEIIDIVSGIMEI